MKKTSNAERRTSNVEWRPLLHELPNSQYRSQKGQKYDLEDRLLEFAVKVE